MNASNKENLMKTGVGLKIVIFFIWKMVTCKIIMSFHLQVTLAIYAKYIKIH